jgi:hypothetical protein
MVDVNPKYKVSLLVFSDESKTLLFICLLLYLPYCIYLYIIKTTVYHCPNVCQEPHLWFINAIDTSTLQLPHPENIKKIEMFSYYKQILPSMNANTYIV